MRLTTVLQWLLGVMQMHVKDAHLGSDGQLQVWVRPLRVGPRREDLDPAVVRSVYPFF